MFVPVLIMTVSTALLFFYFQVVCQKILQRRSTEEYFQSIVNANRLEFPSVRRSIEGFGASAEYSRLRVMLKHDFLVLTYLLKYANNIDQTLYLRGTSSDPLLLGIVCLPRHAPLAAVAGKVCHIKFGCHSAILC